MYRSYRNTIVVMLLLQMLVGALYPSTNQSSEQGRTPSYDSLKYGIRKNFSTDNPKSSRLDLFVDSILQKYMKSYQNCGMSIGIGLGDSMHFYNYGESARNSGKLPSKNTAYELGAISNVFCGYLLADEVSKKMIGMETDIRNFLPKKCGNLSVNGKPIMIKHLAAHTSGLPSTPANLKEQEDFDLSDPYRNYTKKLLFEELEFVDLTAVPGTSCEYSALGMGLLGLALEKSSGQSFEQLLQENILAKLNLKNTWINEKEGMQSVVAKGYDVDGNDAGFWHFGDFPSIGGVHSCTEDMLVFLQQCLKDSPNNRWTEKLLYIGKEKRSAAWFVKDTKQGNTMYWQNGGTGGFSAFVGFIPEKNISFCLLANSAMNLDYLAIAISNYLQR